MISKDIMSYCINRRKSHPNLIWSDPASSEQTVHLASLQLLFFSSVANTAPLWLSRRLLQSTPPLYCKVTCQNNVYEINVLYIFLYIETLGPFLLLLLLYQKDSNQFCNIYPKYFNLTLVDSFYQ